MESAHEYKLLKRHIILYGAARKAGRPYFDCMLPLKSTLRKGRVL